MTVSKNAYVIIANHDVIQVLSSVLDGNEFATTVLRMTPSGIRGRAINKSMTAAMEFEVPRALLANLEIVEETEIAFATQDLESIMSAASANFVEGKTLVSLAPTPTGMDTTFTIEGVLRRRRWVPDLPDEHTNLPHFDDFRSAPQVAIRSPGYLGLVYGSFEHQTGVRLILEKSRLIVRSGRDELILDAVTSGRASTEISEEILRPLNKILALKAISELTLRVVDRGMASFEIPFSAGAGIKYYVTRLIPDVPDEGSPA